MKRILIFAVLSLLFGAETAGQSRSGLRDLKIVEHHWTTAILGSSRDVSVKDAGSSRFIVLKLSGTAAGRSTTLFAPDFVLAYFHRNGNEDRADCEGIGEIKSDGNIDRLINGNVARISVSGETVRFALAFNVESDVERVDLHVLGQPTPLSYQLGTSRPYSVFVTTNRGAPALTEAEQSLRDAGYHVDTSTGLTASASGVTIIHHQPTETMAREISVRLMQQLKVKTKVVTFKEAGVSLSEYDVLVWLGDASLATTRPAAPAQAQVAPRATTVVGEWSENWGTPGQTDVTYHDQYRVTETGPGTVKVEILNRNQKIYDERLDGGVLTFSQRTDAFVVRYSLTLEQDGRWLVGTAKTPEKVVNVKWERTKSPE